MEDKVLISVPRMSSGLRAVPTPEGVEEKLPECPLHIPRTSLSGYPQLLSIAIVK